MVKKPLVGLALILALGTSVRAATRLVPGQYGTIQSAISDCDDGDIVIVDPGTYFESIDFNGKNIVVRSTDPNNPETVAATVIAAPTSASLGRAEGSVVTFTNAEGPQAVLSGFTITGGYGTLDTTTPNETQIFWGGGIYCKSASPTIRRNVITGNAGPSETAGETPEQFIAGYGGGIACSESNAIITNNIIKANSAYAGAGIMVFPGDAEISGNIICDNSAFVGGGLVLFGGRLINNTIVGNDASLGGYQGQAGNVYAVFDPDFGKTSISNNIICSAESGGGVFFEGTEDVPMAFNNVWGNSPSNYMMYDPETYEMIHDGPGDKTGINGNISADPLLVSQQTGDYHLQPDSPCINAGDPAFIPSASQRDIDGHDRVYAMRIDIGADEYVGYVKPHADAGPDQHLERPALVTLDGSGSSTYESSGVMTFQWTQVGGPPVELNDYTVVRPTFTPEPQSEYRFEVVLNDGIESSRPDEVTITIHNRPPIADAGPDQTIDLIPPVVTLDGSGSHDLGGEAITYLWSQTAGPSVELNDHTSVKPTFAPESAGEYQFELIVNDGVSSSEPNEVAIVVRNLPPVANAGADQSTRSIPSMVTLDGNASADPAGEALTYRWSQTAGPVVELSDYDAALSTFVPSEIGIYVFELMVNDGAVDSTADEVVIVIGSDHIPAANAGLPRYTAGDMVVLDGTNSYDPGNSGPLSYQWRQTSGPRVLLKNSNTATPWVSGFVQTDEIQRCEFELVVSNDRHSGLPDAVEVVIVPFLGGTMIRSESGPFDPDKPTFIYFSGGNCVTGSGSWKSTDWHEKANVISFAYEPDDSEGERIYEKCGDIIIVYLSNMAPNYSQPIQVTGFSTGGQPAIDASKHINLTYKDARYAINRVTFFDVACRDYTTDVAEYLASSVDGEQCWLDTYYSAMGRPHASALNVEFTGLAHGVPRKWYRNSLSTDHMNIFKGGCVAGSYWSVLGPGKNLQLASTPDMEMYRFRWTGSDSSGLMDFYDEGVFPGRLPEPVTLIGPIGGSDPNGAVLTCEPSENAVGYELLLGADLHRVMDFMVVSDTPEPPSAAITELPFEQTWWTVRARDQYGSTIYADPIRIDAFSFSLPVENLSAGKRYAYIQDAIDEAYPGDEIVANEGIYNEDIDFRGMSVTLRSIDPNDPSVVAGTVISCTSQGVTFSGGEDESCVLAGFTITGATEGISCSGASPTIIHCSIVGNQASGIELRNSSNPTLTNCEISLNAGAGIEAWAKETGRFRSYNRPVVTNCTIAGNLQNGISGGIPRVANCIIWGNLHPQVAEMRGIGTITDSDVQGGWLGEGNLDADPLFADPANGDYHLKSQAGRWDPQTQSWIQDDVTSPCVDAGNPDSDWSAELLPNGERINMGVYGGTSQASKSFGAGQQPN
ncbi:MAG: PKD domain-containing protein [Planctomycetota bacterium]